MKPENSKKPDQVEKELKGLIDQLNSENAALNKILSMVEPKEVVKPQKTSGVRESNNNKDKKSK